MGTRNIAHENLTGLEGVQAYNLRTLTMLNRLVVGNFESEALPPAEMKAQLMRSWGVRLFRTPGGSGATAARARTKRFTDLYAPV